MPIPFIVPAIAIVGAASAPIVGAVAAGADPGNPSQQLANRISTWVDDTLGFTAAGQRTESGSAGDPHCATVHPAGADDDSHGQAAQSANYDDIDKGGDFSVILGRRIEH